MGELLEEGAPSPLDRLGVPTLGGAEEGVRHQLALGTVKIGVSLGGDLTRSGARGRSVAEHGGGGVAVFEVLGDRVRLVNDESVVDKHRDPSAWVEREEGFGLELLRVEHDALGLVGEALVLEHEPDLPREGEPEP